MHTRLKTLGVGLVAGLLFTGCGGLEPAPEAIQETGLESREDALPSCRTREYSITFYAEPELLTYVGQIVCACNSPGSQLIGRQSPYGERWEGAYCSID